MMKMDKDNHGKTYVQRSWTCPECGKGYLNKRLALSCSRRDRGAQRMVRVVIGRQCTRIWVRPVNEEIERGVFGAIDFEVSQEGRDRLECSGVYDAETFDDGQARKLALRHLRLWLKGMLDAVEDCERMEGQEKDDRGETK